MSDVGRPPWTDEQVANLIRRQIAPIHPYTCESHSHLSLIPTRDGWRCADYKGCDYRQTWAHAYDLAFTEERAEEWRLVSGLADPPA